MKRDSIDTYEKQVIIVNAYNHVVDLFIHKHGQTETPYSVFSDIAEDYSGHLENIGERITGDCFVNEKSRTVVLKHMNDADSLLSDVDADSLTLYPIKRAIRVIKSMDIIEVV